MTALTRLEKLLAAMPADMEALWTGLFSLQEKNHT